MNWTYYESLLDQKITDAQYNSNYADKKAREAKAALESVLREKESFTEALNELMGEDK